MEIKKLLELRKRRKQRKPDFIVKEAKNQAGLKKRWRFPGGRHSGVRQYHKGKPALPSLGYGSPKPVRGLHPSGLREVVINNVKDLSSLDPQKEGMIIASQTGNRKRLELIKAAEEKEVKILNVRDPIKLMKKVEEDFKVRKEIKVKKLQEKDKKKEEKKKKAEEKIRKEKEEKEKTKTVGKEEGVEDKLKEEQEEQKKEAEKVIIKKQ